MFSNLYLTLCKYISFYGEISQKTRLIFRFYLIDYR
nr:MAG TPA: hypothetical protein [Herelleviridae sp.]DAV56480.1 MAG TPA: hypothetical protein [Bacteriophage sp.]DAW36804.1 MAG TPA: hypothetical protein [Caudoviricetes sp.]